MDTRTIKYNDLELEVSESGEIFKKPTKSSFVSRGKQVVATFKGRQLKTCVHSHGYKVVDVVHQGERHRMLVHRLVAEAFCKKPLGCNYVDHIDGNKLNNHYSNLEWVTIQENTKRQWATGLVDIRGEKHPSAKLSNAQVSEIKTLAVDVSVANISKMYKVSTSTIYKILSGVRRGHVSLPG